MKSSSVFYAEPVDGLRSETQQSRCCTLVAVGYLQCTQYESLACAAKVLPYRMLWQRKGNVVRIRCDSMGDFVAQPMVEYYRQRLPQPLSREYDNANWALINLG